MLYSRLPARCGRRRGMIAVQTAVCLMLLMGVAALALDGGLLLAKKRGVQAAADAAALAAAVELYNGKGNYTATVASNATTSAQNVAKANGFDYQSNSTVTTRVSSTTTPATFLGGPNAGQQVPGGYVEVTVQYNQ